VKPENVPNDLAFLVGSRQRIQLEGNGARSVSVVGATAVIGMYFSDELAIVDLAATPPRQIATIDLGGPDHPTVVREGEMRFHDASLCFQTWQSCASCHPSQARADGLNWDLLNDGIGNPKNTKSLLLSHQTPPVMATGVRADAETAVRSGLRHIQFTTRPESEAKAIDEYLKSLEPVRSPYLEAGRESESAERGRLVFESAGCVRCHSGPLMTNGQAFQVGTGRGTEQDQPFDTPSLIEVWRTAPYLHDGRAATIREVLVDYNSGDRHGVTSQLSDQQIDDLAQFVLSQ
jgi:cytochrome c peroxidase